MAMHNRNMGIVGERLAADFMENSGYRILATNFRCPLGEIDIVAEKGPLVAIVEVKTRQDEYCGRPAQAVNIRKQRKIADTAMWFLRSKKMDYRPCRFDVIEVIIPKAGKIIINHIEEAFEC